MNKINFKLEKSPITYASLNVVIKFTGIKSFTNGI